MARTKKRKAPKARSMVALGMILTCKGGPHRDRRERRASQRLKRESASDA